MFPHKYKYQSTKESAVDSSVKGWPRRLDKKTKWPLTVPVLTIKGHFWWFLISNIFCDPLFLLSALTSDFYTHINQIFTPFSLTRTPLFSCVDALKANVLRLTSFQVDYQDFDPAMTARTRRYSNLFDALIPHLFYRFVLSNSLKSLLVLRSLVFLSPLVFTSLHL